jgi:hypothetical protein
LKTQDYFAAPFLLHRKLHSLSSSSPEITITCNTSSFFFSSADTHITSLFSQFFFLSFFSMSAAPFFSSYFPSHNSGPKGKKKKKKKKKKKTTTTTTKFGEDEEVWRGLTKPMLWSPSPAPRVTFSSA